MSQASVLHFSALGSVIHTECSFIVSLPCKNIPSANSSHAKCTVNVRSSVAWGRMKGCWCYLYHRPLSCPLFQNTWACVVKIFFLALCAHCCIYENWPLRNRDVWVNHILYACFHANCAISQPKLRNVIFKCMNKEDGFPIWMHDYSCCVISTLYVLNLKIVERNKCTGIWSKRQFIGCSVPLLTKSSWCHTLFRQVAVSKQEDFWFLCFITRFWSNYEFYWHSSTGQNDLRLKPLFLWCVKIKDKMYQKLRQPHRRAPYECSLWLCVCVGSIELLSALVCESAGAVDHFIFTLLLVCVRER